MVVQLNHIIRQHFRYDKTKTNKSTLMYSTLEYTIGIQFQIHYEI